MSESIWSIIVIGGLIWGGISLFNEPKTETRPQNNTPSHYENPNSYNDYEEVSEPENPYDDGSGHSAGYEWAEENDVDSCGGNSDSFIEGCEEYLDQKETYQEEYANEEDY